MGVIEPLERPQASRHEEKTEAGRSSATFIALAVLAVAVALGAATIMRTPAAYGDEPWIASEINNFVHAGGLRPSIFGGSGLYDHSQDVWSPYLGSLPFMLTALVSKPSLLAYRLTAFLVGLGALGVFALAFRRFGVAIAAAATAALATSWGFIAASHYVRWDSLGFLVVAAVLAVLWRGPPGRRGALWLGVLLGASVDIQASLLALAPGVALLVGWQRQERWRRLGLFGGGLAALILIYFGVHYLPAPSEASRQWKILLAKPYVPPLERAFKRGDLSALYAGEWGRYSQMTDGLSGGKYAVYGGLVMICLGALSSLWGLGRLRSRPRRRPYPAIAVPALLFGSYMLGLPLIQGNKASEMYGWYVLPLAIAAVVALAAGDRAPVRSAGRRAPWALLAGLLAIGGLVALVVSVLPSQVVARGLVDEWFALPLAVAALLAMVSAANRRPTLDLAISPVLVLVIAGAGYFLSDLPKTSQYVTDPRMIAAWHRYVPASESVLAEPVFWWTDPSPRFRSDSTIYLSHAVYGWSFEQSLQHICPTIIAVDDVWLASYHYKTDFPTVSPTNPAEEGLLTSLLGAHYVQIGSVSASGDHVTFWHRRALRCAMNRSTPQRHP
ncbi:MAG: hypothetical protein ACYC91_01885 [Solirubrobacteraceae bacterium]